MRHRVMRYAPVQAIHSTVCSQLAGNHWAALWLANMSAVCKIFYTGNTAKQDGKMQCLQSHYSGGGSSLSTDNTTNPIKHLWKHHVKEHREFLARHQKDERSRQESLLESFQMHSKLPADNVKHKGLPRSCSTSPHLTTSVISGGNHSLIEHLQSRYHPRDTYQRLRYLNYTTECQPS